MSSLPAVKKKWIKIAGLELDLLRWPFLRVFAEESSSFFAFVSLLAGGFSSACSPRFPILVPPDFETDEAADHPTQMPKLQGTFSSRLPERSTPVLLSKGRLPQSP